MAGRLPSEFAELEPFADWALPTEEERYAKRLSSTIDEMQALYDAVMPQLQEALDYLDKFELNELPDDAKHLMWLLYSLVNASFPVEVWRQPHVPDAGASTMDCTLAPSI